MVGELVAGRYELEELVGSGGMSSVYRAHDRLLERKVALKILHERHGEDDEYVERFRREARAVAQLAHPNIVTVIDRGEDGGRQYIVFEYVEGANLKQVVERAGPLPIEQVLDLGVAISSGLAYAHERGIVHRDVKPQNVLLNGDGRAKVTDFGIARSLDVERGVTQTGTVLGTSNYIAPEQASGQPVDERSDVYSLGVVLFELLTGDVPFAGDNFVTVAMRHINEPAPPVLERRPDTPPRLAGLVDAMLDKEHTRRPSMHEVAAELRALRGDTADATVVAPVVRGRRARRRRVWPLAVALAAGLVAAALAAVVLGRGGDGRADVPSLPVTIRAIASFDPGGDGSEHEAEVRYATDGDAATYWPTESYEYGGGGLGKEGVGIVLRASRPPEAIVVSTSTPGFRAEIRGRGGGLLSPSRPVAARTAFPLDDDASGIRELVLWITNRGPNDAVRITEVTAS